MINSLSLFACSGIGELRLHENDIKTVLCGKVARKNFHQEDFNRVSAKVLIDFAKENKMKIGCHMAERAIQSAKENLEFLEKQLVMINELIKGN